MISKQGSVHKRIQTVKEEKSAPQPEIKDGSEPLRVNHLEGFR